MKNIILIDNGKKPNELFNAQMHIGLPGNCPYGNLNLKYHSILSRVDETNRKILETYEAWYSSKKSEIDFNHSIERHIYYNEYIVYNLRRIADELLPLIWILLYNKINSSFPQDIIFDKMGAFVSDRYNNNPIKIDFLDKHSELINLLNSISNAYKHSFINSDLMLIGLSEPRVHALNLHYNKLSNHPQFYDVSLKELIISFNLFYKESIEYLKKINSSS